MIQQLAKTEERSIARQLGVVVRNAHQSHFNVNENLNKTKPDLVGINCLFSGVFPDVLEFAQTIKSHSPNLKIAVGGIHPTTYYKETESWSV